ncbi:cupin domain-containing protein [Streptomyces sp. QTS52]
MVEAARPFRVGTRFQALPDVRFLIDGGRIRAPGDLLPGPHDTSAQRYGERLDQRMEGRGRLLVVEQPLVLDHALWAQVRSLVAPLWERAGYPVLPAITELALGERITEGEGPAQGPLHSTLIWVLHGTVTATPRDAQGGPTLTAGAGDLLHWPAGQPHRVHFESRTLAMRLLVPRDPRLLNAGVKDVVAAMVHERRGQSRVPYLPFPPGQVPTPPDMPELAETAELLRETTATPQLNQALSAVWARRVSAGALEPVPGPRPPVRLSPDDRLRPASTVVRMPLDDGRTWLWAVDGHAFHLRGSLGERVLNRLHQGDTPTVRQLCAVAGPDRDALVLALLKKLYTLRGVDVDVDVDGQEDTA